MKLGEARVGMWVAKLREYDHKPMLYAHGIIKDVRIFQGQEEALVEMEDTGRTECHLTIKLKLLELE